MATLHFNNIVTTRAMHRYEWFLDGTAGSAAASQTALVVSLKEDPYCKHVIALQGSWFSDAFGGSMGELLRARRRRPPQTSGDDNLDTIRIAYATVESSRTGRAVELA
jgi:predicted dehydrogenase